jgi:DivIVA domain-containing protein
MTDSSGTPMRGRLSPHAVRSATFSQRIRGCDPAEVREFLDRVAAELKAAEDERAVLLAEIERLRAAAQPTDTVERGPRGEINSHAVALFSQAQLVADRLVAEHVEHSRALMTTARAQQRELLEQVPRNDYADGRGGASDGGALGGPVGGPVGGMPGGGPPRPYGAPVPEIEYVRTYAQIAQSQLRTVIDALSEQVEKLSGLPRLNDGPEPVQTRELTQARERP